VLWSVARYLDGARTSGSSSDILNSFEIGRQTVAFVSNGGLPHDHVGNFDATSLHQLDQLAHGEFLRTHVCMFITHRREKSAMSVQIFHTA
jgi:hypothetical protein